MWLGAGADPKVVQRVLGHASASMTMDLYGHLVDANLWQAARLVGDISGTFEPSELAFNTATALRCADPSMSRRATWQRGAHGECAVVIGLRVASLAGHGDSDVERAGINLEPEAPAIHDHVARRRRDSGAAVTGDRTGGHRSGRRWRAES